MAALLGETLDSEGIRQSLIAKELSDLPAESLAFALDAWKRGDKRHLSSYQQDIARIGVFFPKPAELREIAELHAADKRARAHEEARRLQDEGEERDRREHPEKYVNIADITAEVFRKKGLEMAAKAEEKRPLVHTCPACGVDLLLEGANLSALRPQDLRALADVMERQAS